MGGASTMGKGKSQCARTGSQSPSDEEIPVKEGRCGVRWVFTSQCGLSAPKQSDAGISTERQPSMWCQYPRRVRGGGGWPSIGIRVLSGVRTVYKGGWAGREVMDLESWYTE